MDLEQLLKSEEKQLHYTESQLDSCKLSISETQEFINSYYYQIGRVSLIEELIKQKYGYKEREFQIRKKKGTLFEKT